MADRIFDNGLKSETFRGIVINYQRCANNLGPEAEETKNYLKTAMQLADIQIMELDKLDIDAGPYFSHTYTIDQVASNPELIEKVMGFCVHSKNSIFQYADKQPIIMDPATKKFLQTYRSHDRIIIDNPYDLNELHEVQDWNPRKVSAKLNSIERSMDLEVFNNGYGILDEKSPKYKMIMFLDFGASIGTDHKKSTNILKVKVKRFEGENITSIEGKVVSESYLKRLPAKLRKAILENPLEF